MSEREPPAALLKPYNDSYEAAGYNGSYQGQVAAREGREAFEKGWRACFDAQASDLAAKDKRIAELKYLLERAAGCIRDGYKPDNLLKEIDAALGGPNAGE